MKIRLVVEVPLVDDECYFPHIENDRREVERKLPATMVVKSAEYVKEEADARALFKKLLRFKVDGSPLRGFKSSDYYSKGDEAEPFYSEAYLYNLLGKDSARTVLAYLHELMESMGLNPLDVEREVNAELAAEAEAEEKREERVAARKKFAMEFCAKKGWKLDADCRRGLDDAQWKELRDAQREAGI